MPEPTAADSDEGQCVDPNANQAGAYEVGFADGRRGVAQNRSSYLDDPIALSHESFQPAEEELAEFLLQKEVAARDQAALGGKP